MTNVSILHISDLHRSGSQKLSNPVLLNSMEAAMEHYARTAPHKLPQLIVVSGDIIQGNRGDNDQATYDLDQQYDEAHSFLTELSKLFVAGDKDKVILIPGNHDISWYHSKKSMKVAEFSGDEKKIMESKWSYRSMMLEAGSRVRWSWSDFHFLNITDESLYLKRLEAFSQFYERFYEGRKTYSLNPSEQFGVFDYPDLNVAAVGFNSCLDNDHCQLSGNIHNDCIAKAARKLREDHFKDRLKIAIWHHNTSGVPNKSDYMDNRLLETLVEANFHIGMHGHAHRTDVTYQSSRIQSERKMVVFSAGSLCAGPKDLPSGELRAFNLIYVNREEQKASVEVLRMIDDHFDNPIWRTAKEDSVKITAPVITIMNSNEVHTLKENNLDSGSSSMPDLNVLSQVEYLIGNKNHKDAISLLEQYNFKDDIVRRLLLECYLELGDYGKIAEKYSEPQSTRETLYLMESYYTLNRKAELRVLLESELVSLSEDPNIKGLSRQYSKGV